MLKKLLKNTKLLNEIKKFYHENEKEIIDILLFGSATRGKENPSDIDILAIYKSKDNMELSYKLKKQLERYKLNIQVTSKKYADLFKPGFKAREAVLSEGYSLINNTFISRGLGYGNMKMFRYELKKLNKSQRMRFYYALYGRDSSGGILKDLNAKKFADTILLCPIENSESLKEFLERWNLSYLEVPALIPERIIGILKS